MKPAAKKAPAAPAKRPASLLDRLAAPTTLKHELMAVGYATGAIGLMLWSLALLKH